MSAGRCNNKEEREKVRARIVEIHQKDVTLSRRVIAQRVGCGEALVVQALKAAGLYEVRARNLGTK